MIRYEVSDLISDELALIKSNMGSVSPCSEFGKLIRSRFGLLILKACGVDINDDYINFLTSVELIHNASLLHDDVIDNEVERRNNLSVNQTAGNRVSILYGNLTLTNSIDYLTKIGSVEIISLINLTVRKMCEGELAQISQLNKIPEMSEYIEKTRLKTGALFSALAQGLVFLSEGKVPSEFISAGESFGTAFQIKNDLDNILTSKTDIKNGIYTAPVIYQGSVNIKEGAIEKTVCLIDNYSREVQEIIAKLEDSDYKYALIGVLECLKK